VTFIIYLKYVLGSVCETVGGNEPGKPCIFSPGTSDACLFFDDADENVFCYTEVDSNGKKIKSKRGTCGPGCPINFTDAERKIIQRKNNKIRLIKSK
jgi:hypothetical protein